MEITEIAKVKVYGTRAETVYCGDITAGIIGATVSLEFSPEWAGLSKHVTFAGVTDKSILNVGDSVPLPPEVVSAPNAIVKIGIIGIDADEKIAIPTMWAELGAVKPGAPVDMGYEPTLPIWAQLMGMIGDLRGLNTKDKSNLVAAVNEAMQIVGKSGGYYTPAVTQPNATTLEISFTPSQETMPVVEPVTIEGQSYTEYLRSNVIDPAVRNELEQAKASGEFDGEDGYSPVRGVDYWTDADKAEIKTYVDDAILGGAW